jgi:hypothetical protein
MYVHGVGVLAMGRVPLGKATLTSGVDAISALLLTGVSFFVSLMEEEEETACEQSSGSDPCQASIQSAAAKARVAVIRILTENNQTIESQTGKLNRLPDLAKVNPNYTKVNRERLRCLARIRLANLSISRASEQLKRLPTAYDWMRLPLSPRHVPHRDHFTPGLRLIEDALLGGKMVYVYSHEGHGRAGLVACCLLGRLYGLTPQDALYRTQACHDCMASETRRTNIVHCPQLPMQRGLVTEVLNETNRFFEGTTVRELVEGDAFHLETQLRCNVRGSELGVRSAVMETNQNHLILPVVVSAIGITSPGNRSMIKGIKQNPNTDFEPIPMIGPAKTAHFKLLREKLEAI